MSTHDLQARLLRPSILHILRAAGFHSTRPSVLDTLTDLYIRYFSLLAERTAQHTYSRQTLTSPTPSLEYTPNETEALDFSTLQPSLSDVRQALQDAYFFTNTLTPSEEAFLERQMALAERQDQSNTTTTTTNGTAAQSSTQDTATLTSSALLDSSIPSDATTIPDTLATATSPHNHAARIEALATRDVREFIDWATGPANAEIRRIANMHTPAHNQSQATLPDPLDPTILPSKEVPPPTQPPAADPANPTTAPEQPEDWLSVLKKKHHRTGEASRWAGTVLGKRGAAAEAATAESLVQQGEVVVVGGSSQQEQGQDQARPSVRIEGGAESLAAWAKKVRVQAREKARGHGRAEGRSDGAEAMVLVA